MRHINVIANDGPSGWEREWAYIQERADAPREPLLGCSTVSHDRLGYCVGCVPALRDGGPNGWALEANGWRLLAVRPADTTGSRS